MENARPTKLRLRQAAFALAERGSWHDISMAAIAEEAGVSLSILMRYAPSKSSILQDFARDIDEAMVRLFEKYPAEGEPHDRLFDVILKRLEILQPYRRVIASLMQTRKADPGEAVRLLQSVSDSIGWIAAAARVEQDSAWQSLGRLGLMRAYVRVLSVWANDDDPGLARTMAALDRSLRDAERFGNGARAVRAAASSIGAAARSFAKRFFEERKKT
jgi:AcrR family transcriptional regulator